MLLNPGPAKPLAEALWSQIDILIPNESEAELLSGIAVTDAASAYTAARVFRQRGVKCVLITLGANGVAVIDDAGERHLPAHVVKAVDTTAAGDSFSAGYLAVRLTGGDAESAARRGHLTASTVIQYRGAIIPREAMPQ